MILFFKKEDAGIIAVDAAKALESQEIEKLNWLVSGATHTEKSEI